MSKPFNPPQRILLGPGPSNVEPRVLQAMMAPLLGHMDPIYFECMDETQALLRRVFETGNRVTLVVPGTGGAGMEACLANLIEDGEEVVVCVNGFFGQRMAELAERWGAKVLRVETEWGRPLDMEKVRETFRKSDARILTMVHAETSTGIRNPIEELKSLPAETTGKLKELVNAAVMPGLSTHLDRERRYVAEFAGTPAFTERLKKLFVKK